ncbi:hypothetical protein [Paenibacillus senegalensis]|uniref:hypothetical protein n=1 Tax=Paenibacillus senegalensis TaxID=1465766 RepID=UPI000288A931|nr:hypothetical protein [Paenibacillus senegalensis]
MLKTCVFDKDGQLINIGEWDEGLQLVEVGTKTIVISKAVTDEEGNIIEPEVTQQHPIYEEHATNLLPDGAYFEEHAVIYDVEHGWRLAGAPTTTKTPVQQLEEDNSFLAMRLATTQARLEQAEREQAQLLILLVTEGVI